MKFIVLQSIFFLTVLVLLSIPLGLYMEKILSGRRVLLTPVLQPLERVSYRLMGVQEENEMDAKRYAISALLFSAIGFLFVFALHLLQGNLPLNPHGMGATSADLAFNTSASFVSNTNWQAYAGEETLSYLTQMLGLTVQNFVSAATGIAVLFVLIRGFTQKQKNTIGNFWKDIIRITLYILLPLSVLLAVLLVSQGVVQNFDAYGPAASQIAIKQLGTNGGGFFGANAAYPFENPTAFSNLLEMLALLLIPAALCITFGKAVKEVKQGAAVYIAMGILLALAMAGTVACEFFLAPAFDGVAFAGNMEGKEVIHGIGGSSLWAAATTAASNGSVNAMLDSFTPLGGMVPLLLMQLGEVVFGGVGSGLYSMIGFVILTVFIAGLMVGRTPEYLGKKIEPFEMKMVSIVLLVPPLITLIGTAVATLKPEAPSWLTNVGAHGFTEILYAFTSMGNNNGSAFAGFFANTVFTNLTGGIIMLIARFVPMIAVLYLAGSFSCKKKIAAGEGTLTTTNGMFVGLLIGIIVLVAALSFMPTLAIGPIADFVTAQQ